MRGLPTRRDRKVEGLPGDGIEDSLGVPDCHQRDRPLAHGNLALGEVQLQALVASNIAACNRSY